MTTKKTSKRTKTTKKTGDALRQEVLKEAEANVARLEAEERAPGTTTPTAAPAAKGRKPKTTKPHAAKNAPKANTGRKGAKLPGAKARKLSGLDAAAQVLAKASEPLAAKAIADKAIALGWKTNGATPHATLYAAMLREIQAKGKASRFTKTARGLFTVGKEAK